MTLVLEGGENTVETAAKAVENKTPVVIIQGSGRAADVIAEAYWTCFLMLYSLIMDRSKTLLINELVISRMHTTNSRYRFYNL